MIEPATPLPWEWVDDESLCSKDRSTWSKYSEPYEHSVIGIRGADSCGDVGLYLDTKDMAYIVHACNSYPFLVKQLKALLKYKPESPYGSEKLAWVAANLLYTQLTTEEAANDDETHSGAEAQAGDPAEHDAP